MLCWCNGANMAGMEKTRAIELLGGSVGSAAKSIGINSQAISQWPDTLPPRLADRVIAALAREGKPIPAELVKVLPALKESA